MRLRLLALCLVVAGPVMAEDGTGLRISASVDTVAQGNLSRGNAQPTNIMVRGAEIMLMAPADHLFDGTLSFAAHGNEDVGVELHEGWIGSTKFIPRSRFRLGQFFLGIGRLNQQVYLCPLGGMGCERQRATTQFAHLVCHRLASIKFAARDNQVSPGLGEGTDHLQPQPAATAGDQHDLTGQIEKTVTHGIHPHHGPEPFRYPTMTLGPANYRL